MFMLLGMVLTSWDMYSVHVTGDGTDVMGYGNVFMLLGVVLRSRDMVMS